MSDASNGDSDLLTSPLQGSGVGRLFVIGGPIGLAIAIVLSLWVSYLHVRFTAVVQSPTTMAAGRPFPVRAQVIPEGSAPTPPVTGQVWIERDGTRHELGALHTTGEGAIAQATLMTPVGLAPGPAQLHVQLESSSPEAMAPMHESVAIEIVEAFGTTEPEPIVAGSTLQHGDDSDPQPTGARIAVRAHGRLLSEFDNTLYVRVTNPDGTPRAGDVEVALVSGGFAGRTGDATTPPLLAKGTLDPWGVLSLHGVLTSAVLRVQVRVLDSAGAVQHRRTVRMVSFAGGVVLRPGALTLASDAPSLELGVESLRRKRPVYVDVHERAGAWVSTLTPPLKVGEPPRLWSLDAPLQPGVVQFEAYPAPNAPGESTALARVQVVEGDPADGASLQPLIDLQRAGVDAPRVEANYESAHETKYWAAVEAITLRGDQVDAARAYLLGTLPLSAYGPQVAIVNRDRVLDAMATKKRTWTLAMRGVLLGGGGLFLALMTFTMMRSHAKGAESTMAALAKITDEDERADARAEIGRAKRAALMRGLGVIIVMALALIGVTILLESLLWSH
ncbi:MAG: hypothetical protein ACE37F_34890 [Nannocystaceae bacterium]|nr:hypothetical protein [bacterium]